MTRFEQFLRENRLRRHKTTVAEVRDLLRVVDRDVLQLATIVLAASRLRAVPGQGHHWVTFVVLPELFKEPGIAELANYFDDCRTKRNVAGYDSIGGISIEEVQELRKEAREFRGRVLGWLRKNHAKLVPR